MVGKIYHNLPLQKPPKFTQNGIFGKKINHLATLPESHIPQGNGEWKFQLKSDSRIKLFNGNSNLS
jgi:hypothetical protein